MRVAAALVLAVLIAAVAPSVAAADGDPGSDVLVYQPLFLEADSGVSIEQQAQLSALLAEAKRANFPIRVAIVASRFDLGAVTGLWRSPRAYARFLGLELSLAYTARLLVVMPNGFGFNWQGHPSGGAYQTLSRTAIKGGGANLADAAETAVRSLAAAAGVNLAAPPGQSSTPSSAAQPGSANGSRAAGSVVDTDIAVAVVALALAGGLGVLVRRRLARRRRASGGHGRPWRFPRPRPVPTLVAVGGCRSMSRSWWW